MDSRDKQRHKADDLFSIDSKLMGILSVFAFTGILLVVITLIAAETLSALQSYSILQSHWTETRKEAMGNLEMYAVTGSQSYLEEYHKGMDVLQDMRRVRLEVTGDDPDYQQVISLLAPMKFSEEEAESMIQTARWFGGIKEFAEAFNLWNEKDQQLAKLDKLADQISSDPLGASGSGAENEQRLEQVDKIGYAITGLHYDLSNVLAQGTYRLKSTIFWSTIGVGLILLIVGGVMTWRFRGSIRKWNEVRVRAEQKIKNQLEERTVLLEEIHHRVKNNLAFVSSLLILKEDEVEHPQAREQLKEAQNQIISIAEIHEIFYDTDNFAGLPAREYAEKILNRIFNMLELEEKSIDYRLTGDDAIITINKAIPFGLILNELATNSCKHAFQQHEEGNVELQIISEREEVRVSYQDNGSGLPPDFNLEEMAASSLGMRLISTFLQQIEADYQIHTGSGGFRLDFSFTA